MTRGRRINEGMRWLLHLVVLAAFAATATATSPPPRTHRDAWHDALQDAHREIEACKLGGKIYGDVDVTYDARTRRWASSWSKSLGRLGYRITKCIRDAIERRFPLHYDVDDVYAPDDLRYSLTIGMRVPVLPPAATILPLWRRAIGTGTGAATARDELQKRLPPDYTLTKDFCLDTKRAAIEQGQYLWLPTVGRWIPRLWHDAIRKLVGANAHAAIWLPPGEILLKRDTALCLVRFGAAQQAALRADMDTAGSCWVGGFEDILLRPRVAFPSNVSYTSVSTYVGRTCATTATGTVVCCGSHDPPLPPAPGPMTSVAIGHGFACGIEPDGDASCWGNISAPPPGKFRKLSATYGHACGLRTTGDIACWSSSPSMIARPPTGDFIDVSAETGGGCAVGRDGRIQCWGEKRPAFLPGLYSSIEMRSHGACAVRRDGLASCWWDHEHPMSIPLPDSFEELALGDGYQMCGRKRDGVVRCTPAVPGTPMSPVPTTPMLAIAAHVRQTCGLRTDRSIECWGDPWPTTWLADNTWPYTSQGFGGSPSVAEPTMTVGGRVVDEHGRALAGVEVLVCNGSQPCDFVVDRAYGSTDSISQILTGLAWLKPDTFARATTATDGRWSARIAKPADYYGRVHTVATAPGREIGERMAHHSAVDQLRSDIVLRPAIELDVSARCGGIPCEGDLRISFGPYRHSQGTRLAHLAPGTYAVRVVRDPGKTTERRGTISLDVTFTTQSQRLELALVPSGTGRSISGRAEVAGTRTGSGPVRVRATCGPPAEAVIRHADANDRGEFVLENVGPPPCAVSIPSATGNDVVVTKLPATHVFVRGQAIESPD